MSPAHLIWLRAKRECLLLKIYRIDKEIALIARREGLTPEEVTALTRK